MTNEAYSFLIRSINSVLALANCYFIGQDYLAITNSLCITFVYVRAAGNGPGPARRGAVLSLLFLGGGGLRPTDSGSLSGMWFAAGFLGIMLIITIVGLTLTAKRWVLAEQKDDIEVRWGACKHMCRRVRRTPCCKKCS